MEKPFFCELEKAFFCNYLRASVFCAGQDVEQFGCLPFSTVQWQRSFCNTMLSPCYEEVLLMGCSTLLFVFVYNTWLCNKWARQQMFPWAKVWFLWLLTSYVFQHGTTWTSSSNWVNIQTHGSSRPAGVHVQPHTHTFKHWAMSHALTVLIGEADSRHWEL